jgi:hypothetical protein
VGAGLAAGAGVGVITGGGVGRALGAGLCGPSVAIGLPPGAGEEVGRGAPDEPGVARGATLAIGVAACGDGVPGGPTPPPPQDARASVTINPAAEGIRPAIRM